MSFATKSLHLQLGSQSVEVPFSVDGHDFNSRVVSNVQQDCTAKAVILPGFQVVLRADVQSTSRALHRSQAFIAETNVATEIRTSHGDADDLEPDLKKSLGVMRVISRAPVSPTWEEGETEPSIALKLENRGTETISIQPGQPLAQLTEVQLHEGNSDDIISLEELKQKGMSPLQMARAGVDGDILGKDDWRSGKASNWIVDYVLEHKATELDSWIQEKNPCVSEDLTKEERRRLQAIAFAFEDVFATGKKPGKMRGVEFCIDFKEPFATPFKERIRRCSPAESAAQVAEVQKMLEADVIQRSNSAWASNVVMVKKKDGSWRFCTD